MPGENNALYELVLDVLNPGISLSFLENSFVSVARTFLKMKVAKFSFLFALFVGLIHECRQIKLK